MPLPETHFPIKAWFNLPLETTPVTGEELEDLEARLGAYIDAHELHWRKSVANEGARFSIKNLEEGDVVLERDTGMLWRYDLETKTWYLIGGHWLAPVAKFSELPASGNEDGDVRLVLETRKIYQWNATPKEWQDFGSTITTCESQTWAIAEKVTVGILPGPFRHIVTDEEQKFIGIAAKFTGGGASAELKVTVKRNGSAVSELKELVLKKGTTKTVTLAIPVTLSTGDQFTLDIEEATEEPEALALSLFIEHIATTH